MTKPEAVDVCWNAMKLHDRNVPCPTEREALAWLVRKLATLDHNWITGQEALTALQASRSDP